MSKSFSSFPNLIGTCLAGARLVLRRAPALIAAVVLVSCATAYANAGITFGGFQSSVPGPGTGSLWNASGAVGPVGVASDTAGNVYIGEYPSGGIYKIDATTHALTSYLTSACGITLSHDQFIITDSSNNLYMADQGSNKVVVWSIATSSCVATYPVSSPFALAIDNSGNLWIGSNGGTIGIYEVPAASPSGTAATMKIPGVSVTGIAFAPVTNAGLSANDLLASNYTGGVVYRYTASSSYSPGSQSTLISGLTHPFGLFFDSAHNLLVACSGTNEVRKYTQPNYTGYVQAMNNTVGAEGIGVDRNDNIYLTSYLGSTVAELSYSVPAQNLATTSTTFNANFQVGAGVTVGSFSVLDQGTSGLEFNQTTPTFGSTCTTGTYGSATACVVAFNFTPTSPGSRHGAIVMYDGSGATIATAYVSGVGIGPEVIFSPTTQQTIYTGAGTHPGGIFVDSANNIYVVNQPANGASKIPFSGGAYGAPVTLATGLNIPGGIAVDGAGNVLIADCANARVVEEPWNGSSYGAQVVLASGLGQCINGIGVDGLGNLYPVGQGTGNILKMVYNGTGWNAPQVIVTGVSSPESVAIDPNGNLFIADFNNNRIAESAFNGTTYAAPTTVSTGVSSPAGVWLDANLDLFASSPGNNTIVRIPWNGSSYGSAVVVAASPAFSVNASVGIALDGSGNLFYANNGNGTIMELPLPTTPNLTFVTPTVVGSADGTDDPQSFAVTNIGNASLSIVVPGSGTNPSFAAGFANDLSSTCPSVSAFGSAGSLAAGATCTYGADFIPVAVGVDNGSATISDNNLNAVNATQVVGLTGTGLANVTQLAWGTGQAPVSTLTAGGNTGTVVVDEENSSSAIVTSATDLITLTVTGPGGYSQTYTSTAVAGVATFNLAADLLTGSGGYTYTASIVASPSVTAVTAPETVNAAAASSITLNTGSGQSAIIGAAFATPLSITVYDQYNNLVPNATVTFAAPVSGASATFSPSATPSTNTSGVASVTATANATAGGPYLATASVSGVAFPINFSLTNLKATPGVLLTPSPASSITYGQAVTAESAKVSYAVGTPTGSVSFLDSAATLGTGTLAAGTATLPSPGYLLAGNHSLTANYGGDANYNTSSTLAAQLYTVNQAPVALTASGSQTVPALSTTSTLALTITGQYTGAGILVPGSGGSSTVTCTFYSGASLLATTTAAVVAGSGASAASCPVPAAVTANGGNYTVTVAFNGDANYLVSGAGTGGGLGNSLNFPFKVQPVTPTITWSPSAANLTVVYGTSLAATLTPSAAYSGSSVPGTWSYTASGVGTVTSATLLPVGTYTITTTFTPSNPANYTTATAQITYKVTPATPTVVTVPSANPVWMGSTVTYTATVTGVAGGLVDTGAVTFYDGATALGTVAVNGSGVATITETLATSGTHSITAKVAADPNYITATSAAVSEVAVDFTVALQSGAANYSNVLPGQTATYNLVITPVGSTTFPGAVALTDSGIPSNSTGTLSVTTVASGASATNFTLAVATTTALVKNENTPLSFGSKLAPLSLALFLLPLAGLRRGRKMWRKMLMVLVLLAGGLAATMGMTGCNLPSGYLGQTPKTFTITVTGTAATLPALNHNTSVTLTIE